MKSYWSMVTVHFPELSNFHPNVEVGEGSLIHSHVWLGNGVRLGKRNKVQAFAFLPPGVTTGDDVFIGPRVTFTNDKNPPSNGKWWESTHVSDGAVIGAGAIILPGIRIGRNAVVGAGAVVTHDVADGETVVGNPARPVYKGPKGAPFDP